MSGSAGVGICKVEKLLGDGWFLNMDAAEHTAELLSLTCFMVSLTSSAGCLPQCSADVGLFTNKKKRFSSFLCSFRNTEAPDTLCSAVGAGSRHPGGS